MSLTISTTTTFVFLLFLYPLLYSLNGCNATQQQFLSSGGLQQQLCNAAEDKCPWQADGECDSEYGFGFDECLGGDCFDCDPCQIYRYNCTECIKNGCYFCSEDSSCLSTTQYQFNKISSCIVESDFATTCHHNNDKNNENFFNDPMYSAQRWIYDMINVLPVWEEGITGLGIRVRINDDGVDMTHPEFDGRFDVFGSCDNSFSPPTIEDNHGTIVASIIGAGSNNGHCAVGIAPNITISSCYALGKSSTFLDTKLDMFDISQNSYNIYACSLGGGGSHRRMIQQQQQEQHQQQRQRQEQTITISSSCPFTYIDPNEVSPCDVCDFATIATGSVGGEDSSSSSSSGGGGSTSTSTNNNNNNNISCQDAVIKHCTLHYEDDPIGCLEFLDILIPTGRCLYNSLTNEQISRISNAIRYGRNGKGIIFVYSAGNQYKSGEDVNFQGYLNTRLTIPVGAVGKDKLHASYSTPGSALLVSAPGGDSENLSNIVAADLMGGGGGDGSGGGSCSTTSYGTSFSSAIVSGVIALMLEVNPNLGWRDVQWILVITSKMVTNDPDDNTQVTNGAGYIHSNFYGFGIVDAEAAVITSKSWINIRPERMVVVESNDQLNLAIPDDPAITITSSLSIELDTIDFIVESVAIYLDIQHASRGDLDIVLTSPSGTQSILHPGNRPERSSSSSSSSSSSNSPESNIDNEQQEGGLWKLLTVRNWGESAIGDWTLSITDISKGYVSNCIDQPFNIFQFGVNVRCLEVELSNICIDGELNESFFNGNIGTMKEFIQTPSSSDNNGLTVLDACCVCGGGISTINNNDWIDQLIKWKIVIYGQNMNNNENSSSSSTTIGSKQSLVKSTVLNVLLFTIFTISLQTITTSRS